MAETIHPEDALFNAGASGGYYEMVGASYTPSDPATGTPGTATPGTAAPGTPGTATIDLSTADQTGCLLVHNYATGETTLKWGSDLGENLYGTADDIQTAVEDITRGQLDHRGLFRAFRAQMTLAPDA